MDGGTPRQVFEANLNPRQRPTPDTATLALLMADHQRRLVHECAVRLNNHRYIPADSDAAAVMHSLNDTEILIAYDPSAPESASALDLNGHFICALEAENLVRFAPADPEVKTIVQASMAQRRHLEKNVRETVQNIAAVARRNGVLSPLEVMANRLRLPSCTDIADVITQRDARLTPKHDSPSRPTTPAEAARIALQSLGRNQ